MNPNQQPPNQYNPNFNPNMQNPQQLPNNYQPNMQQMHNNQMMGQQNMQNPNMPPQMNMGYPNNQIQPLNGPPMQGQPQYVNNLIPFIPHKEKIMMTQGIFVKQKMSALEVVTGCERQNKYDIYLKKDGKVKKKGKPLWKAKEKSGCCSRNCLDNQCRPMKLKITNCSQLDDDPQCILMEKECTCTCLCFNRPVIDIYYTEDQNSSKQKLGSIKDNFDCCHFTFNVYNHQGQKAFRVFTTCCQCGIWCGGCPCQPCERVNFQVYDKSGKKLLEIKKKNKDCLKSAFSDADNFGVDYPPNMGWEDRTLLMCTILFIDYMMFEEKGGMADNSGGF